MLSAHQIAHSGPGKPSVDSRRAIAKHAKLSPSRRSCVDHRGPHPAENSFHTTKTRSGQSPAGELQAAALKIGSLVLVGLARDMRSRFAGRTSWCPLVL